MISPGRFKCRSAACSCYFRTCVTYHVKRSISWCSTKQGWYSYHVICSRPDFASNLPLEFEQTFIYLSSIFIIYTLSVLLANHIYYKNSEYLWIVGTTFFRYWFLSVKQVHDLLYCIGRKTSSKRRKI